MTPKQLIYEMRLNDYKGDKWGTAMHYFFDCAEAMTYNFGFTPSEWQYRPSPMGVILEEGNVFVDCTEDELIRLGNFLQRLTNMLEKAGLSY